MSMTTICAFFCALLVASVSGAQELEIPRFIRTCDRSAPDYSSCLRLAIQEAWPTIVKGLPEFQLPVLDPMTFERMETNYHIGEVTGTFVLRDSKTYGMAKIKFLAVRPYFSGKTMNLEVDIEIPKVFIDGDYKAEGSLGPYKIGGKGYFNVSMEGVTATWGLEGRVENDRWVIEHFRLYPEVESMKVYFTDFFNGNKELNHAALTFVNEYWPVLYKGMLPVTANHWDIHLSDFVNRLFLSKVSVSKLFP